MATQSGATFRFVNVDAVIGVLGRIDGYDDGASIVLTPQGDKNTYRRGNDGIGVFAEQAGDEVRAVLSLLANSKANDLLSVWLRSGITRSFTVLDRNNKGKTVCSTAQARVRQFPPITMSGQVEVRAWEVIMSNPEIFVAGQDPD